MLAYKLNCCAKTGGGELEFGGWAQPPLPPLATALLLRRAKVNILKT